MRTPPAVASLVLVASLSLLATGAGPPAKPASAPALLFSQFDLPQEWQTRFWAEPGVKALLALEPKALADMVPSQSGLRFCRCPACDATEEDNPLVWNAAKPKVITCRRCKVELPNDKLPAKDEKEKKVPEETVEVLPQRIHHYPYHAVEPEKQRYPDERIYLDAKRDYEVREFLAKAVLYAAVRAAERPAGARDPRLTGFACTLLLRFAQVYPAYAMHYDQLNEPKYFQPANLPPPYRRGFKTAKWDWTGSLDVPLNLVIAYALLRDDPALADAGRLLEEPNPARTIEHDLFRASAEFVRLQPDDFSELSLQAYRGMLAVGQLVSDPALIQESRTRLLAFSERGFYHDGLWRQGDSRAHRRVLSMIDGWINRLLAPTSVRGVAGGDWVEAPMLALVRSASGALLGDPRTEDVQLASWPQPASRPATRQPKLLGGAGLARLAVGEGRDALDVELRGPDSLAAAHFQRLAVRFSVGGRPVLGDLDDLPPGGTGWERATAAHNTVVVDGLNQRESAIKSAVPAPGANVIFFAADPDFQVATLDDRFAYPSSTTRYRHTVAISATNAMHYAVSVFEVHGGLQHDQLFHAAPGLNGRWELSVPEAPPPATLLPPSIIYVPTARAEDGRWFVQAFGEFRLLGQAHVVRPAAGTLKPSQPAPSVRLHLLGDGPQTLYTAFSRDPSLPATSLEEQGRAGLIVRRRSADGAPLTSTFVTVYEPIGAGAGLRRVGRVQSPEGTVVIYLETNQSAEHLVVNLVPGRTQTVPLADGRKLRTDGPVVRVAQDAITLAGGTFAESASGRVDHPLITGKLTRAAREALGPSRGWFETDVDIPEPERFAGRELLVQHGDGSTHGWTIHQIERRSQGARLHVVEEPGFLISDATREAHYYQFPRTNVPGPHQFWVLDIAR
ncbi:MAG: heparinase II/III family protein [Isosphaeraceae bacterium]|nr:heparinase II/III family protein [Isosphaeraceae bacterium]